MGWLGATEQARSQLKSGRNGRVSCLDGSSELAIAESGMELNESLILAQDKRWRRALRMQVERPLSGGSGGRVRNTYVTCPKPGDNRPKGWLIPHVVFFLRGGE